MSEFLLWHHYQQSSFVQEAVPFLFGTLELAAKLAYIILDREYETAPENERLLTYLSEMPEIGATLKRPKRKSRRTRSWMRFTVATPGVVPLWLLFQRGQPAPAVYPPADGKLASGSHRTARLFCADGNDHRRQKQSSGAHFLRMALQDLQEHAYHKLWEDEEFRKKAIEQYEKVDHEKAIHDYYLLKAKGYEDKFIFLEDVKTLKEFLKEIEFELPKDIRFPQNTRKASS